MKVKIYFIFTILITLVVLVLLKNIQTCQRLSCIDMDGLNNFVVNEIYAENKTNYRSLYSYNNTLLRVETIFQPDQFSASQYIAANISQVKGLFADSLSPYPGVVSNTITCEEKYQPIFNTLITPEKLEISYFIAFLNNNLTYGSCTDDQITNKGISVYFYCPKNKTTYHLEFISSTKDFDSASDSLKNMIESIKCR